MGINRDINAKNSGKGVGKFIRLGSGDGYRGKVLLFDERGHRVNE